MFIADACNYMRSYPIQKISHSTGCSLRVELYLMFCLHDDAIARLFTHLSSKVLI